MLSRRFRHARRAGNVDYDDLFKLFMTSKMPNPHYLPEVAIKTTIINFTVTMEGLEDQLLGPRRGVGT